MANQDEAKQERLLHLAGWLHHRHRMATPAHGSGVTEVRFTRSDFDHVDALAAYAATAGAAGERAIIRDFAELREFGLQIDWDAEEQTWVSRAAPLSDAECRALAAAALSVLVEDATPGPTGYHLPGAALSPNAATLIVAFAPEIDTAIDAVGTRTRVQMKHRGKERIVEPWSVVLRDGRWYLVGFDPEAKERRIFSFDAIGRITPTGLSGVFAIPNEDFEALAVEAGDPNRRADAGDPIEVELRVDARLAQRAAALLGAETTGPPDADGWVDMTCTVRNLDNFVHRLFGLKRRAVVIGPEQVRSVVVDRLRAMV